MSENNQLANLIPVYRPRLSGNVKKYVNECVDSTWISSKGNFVNEFENSFCKFSGSAYATTVSNGTTAIHLALLALGIREGDEVIVPTFTYVATVNVILQVGATPVFVDSLQDTWQIDCGDVVQKISSKTKAVLAVHLYGFPCEVDSLVSICDQYDLFLIEDCAEAFGSSVNDKHVGTFGDIGTFSFFGNKTITTGEGGMLITNNSEVYEKAANLKNQGVSQSIEYWHDVLGYNYRMTNICAAIGLAQLEISEGILSDKKDIADYYFSKLKHLPITFHRARGNVVHSYWMCSIAVANLDTRNMLRDHLMTHNIETRPGFPCVHTMPHVDKPGIFEVAEGLSNTVINLPSYPDLSCEEIDRVVDKIEDCLGGCK